MPEVRSLTPGSAFSGIFYLPCQHLNACMLARRKRRQGDEEELLVPHGLIWQATEQQMAPPSPVSAAPVRNEEPPRAIARPDPPPEQLSQSTPETSKKQKLGAISPPLAWPSPKIQEIARAARSRVSMPNARGPSFAEPAAVADALTTTRHAESRQVLRQKLASKVRIQREKFLAAFLRCRATTTAALSAMKDAAATVRAKAQGIHQLLETRKQLRKWQEHTAEFQAPLLPATFTDEGVKPPRTGFQGLALFTALKRGTVQGATWVSTQGMRVFRTLRESTNSSAQAARRFQIKLKLQLPRTAALGYSWVRWNEAARSHLAQQDSRLWTSMAMAGLSAVLALVLVSALRGYSPDNTPSKVSASTPATPISPPGIAAAEPSHVGATSSQAHASPLVKRTSVSTPVSQTSPRKIVRRRVRHHEEDDYIARDTYVYYGPNGKQSH
jgi:hypothetical protein